MQRGRKTTTATTTDDVSAIRPLTVQKPRSRALIMGNRCVLENLWSTDVIPLSVRRLHVLPLKKYDSFNARK